MKHPVSNNSNIRHNNLCQFDTTCICVRNTKIVQVSIVAKQRTFVNTIDNQSALAILLLLLQDAKKQEFAACQGGCAGAMGPTPSGEMLLLILFPWPSGRARPGEAALNRVFPDRPYFSVFHSFGRFCRRLRAGCLPRSTNSQNPHDQTSIPGLILIQKLHQTSFLFHYPRNYE